MRRQFGARGGFTRIEIVIVILLLVIVAAIAITKYVDLKSRAQGSEADGFVRAAAPSCTLGFAEESIDRFKATSPDYTATHRNYQKEGSSDLKFDKLIVAEDLEQGSTN